MTVSTQMLVGLVGLLLGAANFIGFRAKLSEGRTQGATPSRMRLWTFLAWFDLIAFPIVGYYVPVIFRGL